MDDPRAIKIGSGTERVPPGLCPGVFNSDWIGERGEPAWLDSTGGGCGLDNVVADIWGYELLERAPASPRDRLYRVANRYRVRTMPEA